MPKAEVSTSISGKAPGSESQVEGMWTLMSTALIVRGSTIYYGQNIIHCYP